MDTVMVRKNSLAPFASQGVELKHLGPAKVWKGCAWEAQKKKRKELDHE